MAISLNHAIFTVNHNSLQKRRKHTKLPSRVSRRSYKQSFVIIKNYNQYDFQDFQGYAKPTRLLEATEPKVCSKTSEDTDFRSIRIGKSRSLIKVMLQTSNVYGSSLSDQNAGVLLCLIDTNGNSILQRMPLIFQSNPSESTSKDEGDVLHFQRGSVDEFIFEGPNLERIEALWVGVESGQWRLGGVNLTVITTSHVQSSSEEKEGDEIQLTSFQYKFEEDDILLGEGSDTSVVELRPSSVSDSSGIDPFNILGKSPSKPTSISKEESMREYANLKLSLLSYDAALVLVGSVIANVSAGEHEAFAYFIGGVIGFIYLLLLQRSVDELPTSLPISGDTNRIDQIFGRVGGPVSGLTLAIGFSALAVKFSSGDLQMELTPNEVLAGMIGFLACKLAVVLAAVKPMSVGPDENGTDSS